MKLDIEGKRALISGADSGIGFETAQLLLAEGAKVAITDIDQARLDAAVKQLDADVVAIAADLRSQADVDALHAGVSEQFGAVDILINCAGITGAQGMFHEIDDQGWLDAYETNFMSAVRLVRAFVQQMRQSKWGRIVLVASEDGQQPYADELPYCASKAAILNLAKGLSKSYASDGILVNSVSPAFIETPMTDTMMQKRADKNGTSFDEAVESFLKEERPTLELQRRGQPQEVAATIAFLCSERASFINGSNYRVDGGSVATI